MANSGPMGHINGPNHVLTGLQLVLPRICSLAVGCLLDGGCPTNRSCTVGGPG